MSSYKSLTSNSILRHINLDKPRLIRRAGQDYRPSLVFTAISATNLTWDCTFLTSTPLSRWRTLLPKSKTCSICHQALPFLQVLLEKHLATLFYQLLEGSFVKLFHPVVVHTQRWHRKALMACYFQHLPVQDGKGSGKAIGQQSVARYISLVFLALCCF